MKTVFPTLSLLLFLCPIFTLVWADVSAACQGPKEVECWFERLGQVRQPELTTKLHFYFHELVAGRNKTAAVVGQASMATSSPSVSAMFVVVDNPMTVGQGFNSERVGYVKGFYGAASLEDMDFTMAMTFVFTDGEFSGSSLSMLGHNPHLNQKYRELPIVGGSGLFRLARGVATLQTYSFNVAAGNVTFEVDIVVLHY